MPDKRAGGIPLPRGRRRRASSASPLGGLVALLLLGWLRHPTGLALLLWLGVPAVLVVVVVAGRVLTGRRRAELRRAGIGQVDRMSGQEFEHKVGQVLADLGYRTRVTRASGDYGADVVAQRAGERVVIQAKCYGAGQRVGVEAVQQAASAVAFYEANRAMVVTNRDFTQPARRLARATGTELWGRERLVREMARLAAARGAAADPGEGTITAP